MLGVTVGGPIKESDRRFRIFDLSKNYEGEKNMLIW